VLDPEELTPDELEVAAVDPVTVSPPQPARVATLAAQRSAAPSWLDIEALT